MKRDTTEADFLKDVAACGRSRLSAGLAVF